MKGGIYKNNELVNDFFIRAIIALIASVPFILFAQDNVEQPVPAGDVVKAIADLIKNWKGLSSIGIASSIVLILLQITKTEILGNFFDKLNPFLKRGLITVLGQISGVLIAINSGLGWIEAVITGLFVSGGAVAIYEAIKPFFKKVKESEGIL